MENCPWKTMILYWKNGHLFCNSRYYGQAAPFVRLYMDTMHSAVDETGHVLRSCCVRPPGKHTAHTSLIESQRDTQVYLEIEIERMIVATAGNHQMQCSKNAWSGHRWRSATSSFGGGRSCGSFQATSATPGRSPARSRRPSTTLAGSSTRPALRSWRSAHSRILAGPHWSGCMAACLGPILPALSHTQVLVVPFTRRSCSMNAQMPAHPRQTVSKPASGLRNRPTHRAGQCSRATSRRRKNATYSTSVTSQEPAIQSLRMGTLQGNAPPRRFRTRLLSVVAPSRIRKVRILY